jgi:hypothetical protein
LESVHYVMYFGTGCYDSIMNVSTYVNKLYVLLLNRTVCKRATVVPEMLTEISEVPNEASSYLDSYTCMFINKSKSKPIPVTGREGP